MIVNEIAKFRNPPIAAEELLRVAEPVKDLLVLRGLVRGRCVGAQVLPSFRLPGRRY